MPIEYLIGGWGVVLLAETIPEDIRVAKLFESFKQDIGSGSSQHWGWPAAIALTFAAAPPEVLPTCYLRLLARLQIRGAEYYGPQLLSAVSRRLRRDPQAVETWAQAIAQPDSSGPMLDIFSNDEKVILGPDPKAAEIIQQSLLASVLAASVHVEPGLADKLRSIHAAMSSAPPPQLWQDAIGTSRSTWLELADVLDTTG